MQSFQKLGMKYTISPEFFSRSFIPLYSATKLSFPDFPSNSFTFEYPDWFWNASSIDQQCEEIKNVFNKLLLGSLKAYG